MESSPPFHPNPDLKLMDQVRETLRYFHYAYRTEQSYCQWILRYIRYCGVINDNYFSRSTTNPESPIFEELYGIDMDVSKTTVGG